jgi:hypothetical protein
VNLNPSFNVYLDASAVTGPGAGNNESAQSSRGYEPQREMDAWRPRPFQVMVTQTIANEAGAPKPPNPDDAVLERARLAAGGCFRSLPGYVPVRSAHIVFTVISTGTVTNADVSSPDTTDDTVLGCIQQQAMSTTFSDNADGPLRTYAIDVRVTAQSGSGGR